MRRRPKKNHLTLHEVIQWMVFGIYVVILILQLVMLLSQ